LAQIGTATTLSEHRAAASRWQESQRKTVPASVGELLAALKRLWAEAAELAEHAYVAIGKHSFGPYWTFRAKIDEHAALVTVLRGRLPALREMQARQADDVAAIVDREEQELIILSVKACLRFSFALSANPWLPVGARETFVHEIGALNEARRLLEQGPVEKLPDGMLDELGTAQMILEEIIEKSPSLVDFDQPPPSGDAPPTAGA
jgi:hypothetical protein